MMTPVKLHITTKWRQDLLMVFAMIFMSATSFAQVSWEVTNVSCNGKEDGEIDLTVSGPNGDYDFEWSNGHTGEDLIEVGPGKYTVKVFDKDDCVFEETIEVELEENIPQVTIDGGGPKSSCQGSDPDPVRLFAVATQCEECEYRWNNGTTSPSVKVARSGNYTVTVTDKNGCTVEATTNVSISERDCSDNNKNKEDFRTRILASFDPNDILGPDGVGEEKWVAVDDVLSYKVRFENSPDFATGPAQVVTVRSPIDPDANFFSFRLGSFGFGDFVFQIPEGNTFYSTRLDVTDSLGVVVDLTAGIDVTKKEAFWIFESKDPETGLPPEEGSLGFLLVNDTLNRRGEGFVNFSLQPNTQVQTGDTISAYADIVFDNNESLLTNTHINLVDAIPASSQIDAVDSPADSLTMISVFSEDDFGAPASGVASYDLYYSVDNGTRYELLQGDIGVTEDYEFKGELGEAYCMYSVARDSVGNAETKYFADVCFEVRKASVITLLAPNGGELLCSGDDLAIFWESTEVELVNISYSADGGGSFASVATELPAANESYNWTTPEDLATSTMGIIKVESAEDPDVMDTSDESITIYGHQHVEISSEEIAACDGETILLDAGSGYVAYDWSTGETTQTIEVEASGVYSVSVNDLNGCSSSDEIEITIYEHQLVAIESEQISRCDGESILLDAGAGYQSYSWSTGATTPTIEATTSGNYEVTVTDANGCSSVDEISISIYDHQPVAIAREMDAACIGEIIVLDAGSGYDTYEWSTGATTQTIEVNTSGVYSVTVSELNGCSSTDDVEITIYEHEQVAIASEEISTCDGGVILLDAGEGYESYEWSTGETTQAIEASASGTYVVTATDLNGCSSNDNIEITIFDHQPVAIVSEADAACIGETIILDAGEEYEVYEWSTGATTPTIEVEASGVYSVSVTDVNGCSSSDDIEITIYDHVTVSIESEEVFACEGETILLDAGDGYESYEWSTGANTSSIEVATSGTYALTVFDQNGCSSSDEIEITIYDHIEVSIASEVNAVCEGGIILLDAGSGYGSYSWSTGESTQTIAVNESGVYSVLVTDLNGCSSSDDAVITVYPLPETPVIVAQGPTEFCPGESVLLQAPAGYAAYLWSTGETTADIIVSQSGDYTVEVTDVNGCQAVSTFISVIVEDESAPSISVVEEVLVSATPGLCGADISFSPPVVSDNCQVASVLNDFTDTDNANGFYPVGETLIVWTVSDPSGNTTRDSTLVFVVDDQAPVATECPSDLLITAKDGCTALVSWNPPTWEENCEILTVSSNYEPGVALPVGEHVIAYTARDEVGNESTCQFNITIVGQALVVELNSPTYNCGHEISCSGADDGAIVSSVSGGCAPYTYLWSNGATTADISGLMPGDYSVIVRDSYGQEQTAEITLTAPDALAIEFDATQISCNGANDGSATATISGGCEPYEFSWDTGSPGNTIDQLGPGSYTFTATDANGCTVSESVLIEAPLPLSADLGADTTVYRSYPPMECITLEPAIDGGTAPFSYLWSTGETTPAISVCPTDSTGYTVAVTDANGCTAEDGIGVSTLIVGCGLDRVFVCRPLDIDANLREVLCVLISEVPTYEAQGYSVGLCRGEDLVTGIADALDLQSLISAYPNPFTDATTIQVNMPITTRVTIEVYDLSGNKLEELFDDEMFAGEQYEIDFRPKADYVDGVYLYRVTTEEGVTYSNRFILQRK